LQQTFLSRYGECHHAANGRKAGRHSLDRHMTGVRIDKWLWAARFFKTRSLAARACELGRVQSNGQAVKAAREIRVGDMLQVKNPSGEFQVEVLVLSDMRGRAVVAQTLYRETEASRALRLKVAEERRAMPRVEDVREGKPSKRDRREIDRLRGRM
jgi:ribosome-associated heat shock protein Hsp15